mmetsp:Transcript_5914/g.543  ORF Transcript_5914/g.543 Transcript_5914/m.543 type:complete len:84 (+) Transcript_5914:132-383(+)
MKSIKEILKFTSLNNFNLNILILFNLLKIKMYIIKNTNNLLKANSLKVLILHLIMLEVLVQMFLNLKKKDLKQVRIIPLGIVN